MIVLLSGASSFLTDYFHFPLARRGGGCQRVKSKMWAVEEEAKEEESVKKNVFVRGRVYIGF